MSFVSHLQNQNVKRLTSKLAKSTFLSIYHSNSVMELDYKVQNYQWGKKGEDSVVFRLYANTRALGKNDLSQRYAELWIGTHENGPSTVKKLDGQTLKEVIKKHPEYLGNEVRTCFGPDLPFLFKVLSIDTALSIQAHPDKEFAAKLHKRDPKLYRDSNHKPELAIALTPFEALCGFRPFPDILHFFKNVPELRNLVGDEIIDDMSKANTSNADALRGAVRAVLMTPRKVVHRELKTLVARLKTLENPDKETYLADLILKLYGQYPGDVGCFMVYFFNYLTLKPFESIFLAANIPHAYISGDCIECMANSDNVVRAGLTPKPKDVETLISMLNYKGEPAMAQLFVPQQEDDFTRAFTPPVPDFAVFEYKIPVSAGKHTIKARRSASTLIVIEGEAECAGIHLKPGVAFFVPAKVALPITEIKSNVLMYQSSVNV